MLVRQPSQGGRAIGPIIGVPVDVAQTIKDETDLVEVDEVLPDVIDAPDVQLGGAPFGDRLLLTEAPHQGYDGLVTIFTDYAKSGPRPFDLIVMDKEGNPHAFPPHLEPHGQAIRDHLQLAFYGEPGDRRPLIRDAQPSPS
jgi:hypothetical protein